MASAQTNPFLLAADQPAQLLSLLQADPSIASSQDEHGYSLMHAAASYNHLDLLRKLANEYHVDVNLKDEDGETALFVAETIECAKLLVEELHADFKIRGDEGNSAREKIAEDGDFPEVAVYLRMRELEAEHNGNVGSIGSTMNGVTTNGATTNGIHPPPPIPEGLSVDFGTMAPEDVGEVADPEFRRRIEELAARADFEGEAGQEELRNLITEALRGGDLGQEREVRQRTS